MTEGRAHTALPPQHPESQPAQGTSGTARTRGLSLSSSRDPVYYTRPLRDFRLFGVD